MICIFSLGNSYAQMSPFYENLDKYKAIDSAYIKCSYHLSYLRDSTRPENKSTDIQTLLIGKQISKYYSQKSLDHNRHIKEKFEGADAYPSFPSGVWSIEVFKNYPQGKETVTDIGSALKGNYVYEEELPAPNWTIINERQTILSYNCQKAVTRFQGREYIAWFAPDIPIPNGPWKLGGLPGLILKLSDSKDNFVFECKGMENLKEKMEVIKYYSVDYIRLSRHDWHKLSQRFHDDFIKYQNALGVEVIMMNPETNQKTNQSSWKLPYNPIELE